MSVALFGWLGRPGHPALRLAAPVEVHLGQRDLPAGVRALEVAGQVQQGEQQRLVLRERPPALAGV